MTFFALTLTSCMPESISNKEVWVEVNGKTLTKAEVLANLPKDFNPNDSAAIVDDYANKWIKKQLLINKAEKNIGKNSEIDKLVKRYKEQLLIENYVRLLVEHKADINPTTEQINEFYEKNKEQYLLSENILKGIFIVLPLDAPNKNDLKDLLKTEEIDKTLIEAYCLQNAAKVDFFTEKWIPFRLLKKLLPETNKTELELITRNQYYETADSIFNYIIKIDEYKLEGDIAPLNFIQKEIESYILNNNKIEYIKQMKEDIYNEAIRKETIQFTNK